jgi:hypothetical protein
MAGKLLDDGWIALKNYIHTTVFLIPDSGRIETRAAGASALHRRNIYGTAPDKVSLTA